MKLDSTLKTIFPDDWERILTCAYYLVSECGALAHVEKWQQSYTSPYKGKLSSQRICELIARITPSFQQDFFCLWTRNNHQDEYYAMDIPVYNLVGILGLKLIKQKILKNGEA